MGSLRNDRASNTPGPGHVGCLLLGRDSITRVGLDSGNSNPNYTVRYMLKKEVVDPAGQAYVVVVGGSYGGKTSGQYCMYVREGWPTVLYARRGFLAGGVAAAVGRGSRLLVDTHETLAQSHACQPSSRFINRARYLPKQQCRQGGGELECRRGLSFPYHEFHPSHSQPFPRLLSHTRPPSQNPPIPVPAFLPTAT